MRPRRTPRKSQSKRTIRWEQCRVIAITGLRRRNLQIPRGCGVSQNGLPFHSAAARHSPEFARLAEPGFRGGSFQELRESPGNRDPFLAGKVFPRCRRRLPYRRHPRQPHRGLHPAEAVLRQDRRSRPDRRLIPPYVDLHCCVSGFTRMPARRSDPCGPPSRPDKARQGLNQPAQSPHPGKPRKYSYPDKAWGTCAQAPT